MTLYLKFIIAAFTTSYFFVLCVSANASVIIGGTRVIYESDSAETSLSVRNTRESPYLIQSWVDDKGPIESESSESNSVPFVVTPPLYRLDGEQNSLVRLVYTGNASAEEVESVYWLNIKAIPARETQLENTLQFAIKSRIKLFLRPSNLSRPSQSDYASLSFQVEEDNLLVTNPSPYFISFYSLNISDQPITTTNVMVAPRSSSTYQLPSRVRSGTLKYRVINDFGGYSAEISKTL